LFEPILVFSVLVLVVSAGLVSSSGGGPLSTPLKTPSKE
jgi:hypothetical protein